MISPILRASGWIGVLDELHVTNFGVVEDLTISIGPGMTVISGETGAGKTLIVDALSMLGGQRADVNLIRSGALYARVEARFHEGSDEIVIARQIQSDDPSRAYINGSISRVSDLASLTYSMFHIYGQHDAQLLFSSSAQAATLDTFSSIDHSLLSEVRGKLAQARNRLSELGGDERSRQRELSICQSEFDEISAIKINDPQEELRIKQELELLSNAIEFRESLERVHALLIEGEDKPSAMDQLGDARRILAHTNSYSSSVERLNEQIDSLRDVGREILFEIERLDPDPGRFEQLQDRLFELSKIKRRYGDTLDEVIKYRERVAVRIEELSSFEILARRLETEIEEYIAETGRLEGEILASRITGAQRLSSGVAKRLSSLAMPNGRFEIHLGKSGIGDPVLFMFSSNAGERLGPVSKVASGGELSRLMLAIRLMSGTQVPTMIFDEIDAGIGGKTAISVGEALAELSATKQVIVVTHLAQVAAFANQQIAISKLVENGRTITIGRRVDGEERVSEMARMLSGHKESEKAKDHARELLSNSGRL